MERLALLSYNINPLAAVLCCAVLCCAVLCWACSCALGRSVDTAAAAVLQASKGRVALLQLLMHHGAKVNARDSTGSTPLHRAAGAGQHEAVRALLESHQVKIDAVDKTGATPLFVAVQTKSANCAVLLAAKGADLEVRACWLGAAHHLLAMSRI